MGTRLTRSVSLELPMFVRERLPAELTTSLVGAVDLVAAWTAGLPDESRFYLNSIVTIRQPGDIPNGYRRNDVLLADVFFDVHSMLAAVCLAKSWRLGQLTDGFVGALKSWDLSTAACVARALVETAAAVLVECRQVAVVWGRVKGRRIECEADAMQARSELVAASIQMGWGTRLPWRLESTPGIQRTNVLTLIDSAAAVTNRVGLRSAYDVLCDAVHPSAGSFECFWKEAGTAGDQARVLLSRKAIGWIDDSDLEAIRPGSPLSGVILHLGEWSLRTLARELADFAVLCRDISLSSRLHLLEGLDVWGVVKPSGTYELCSCQSGEKTRFCVHQFG